MLEIEVRRGVRFRTWVRVRDSFRIRKMKILARVRIRVKIWDKS